MLIGSIILAGGHSERMNQPKASLEWGDASMLHSRVECMLACAHPVVVVGRDPDQDLPPIDQEAEIVYDSLPGEGPLVGMLAGLERVTWECDAAVVFGCDFPFFDADTLRWLLGQLGDHDAAIPVVDGQPQPLCAIYRTSIATKVSELVKNGERKAQALAGLDNVVLIDDAAITAFDPERRFLFNVNSEDDYQQALQWKS